MTTAARIVIDCRKIADFGIGTYIRGLLSGILQIDGAERYLLLVPRGVENLVPQDSRFSIENFDAPHYSIREMRALDTLLSRISPDLFHSPHYITPFGRHRMAVTIHDFIHLHRGTGLTGPVKRTAARWMLSRAVSNAAVIFTVSQTVAGELVARYPSAATRVAITPNGVDALFDSAPQPADVMALERLGLARERYLLSVGNDRPHKNVALLVRAFEQLNDDGNLKLVLTGGTFERFAGPRVITPGHLQQQELAALYRHALVVVQPSLDEGFGLPALEALASGAAIITSRQNALVEVSGTAALHVDCTDAETLRAAVQALVRDPAERGRLRHAGPPQAAKYTWKECARLTVAKYREAISGRF